MLIMKIENPQDLVQAVKETRETIIRNLGSEDSFLVKDCTVEAVILTHEKYGWSFEEILQDLIYESWGEDC